MRDMDIKTLISKAGGARKVGEAFGISTQAVYKWQAVPAKYAVDVAAMAGMKPEVVRPDVFRKSA